MHKLDVIKLCTGGGGKRSCVCTKWMTIFNDTRLTLAVLAAHARARAVTVEGVVGADALSRAACGGLTGV